MLRISLNVFIRNTIQVYNYLNVFKRINKLERTVGTLLSRSGTQEAQLTALRWQVNNPSKFKISQKVIYETKVYVIINITPLLGEYGMGNYYMYTLKREENPRRKSSKVILKTAYQCNQLKPYRVKRK